MAGRALLCLHIWSSSGAGHALLATEDAISLLQEVPSQQVAQTAPLSDALDSLQRGLSQVDSADVINTLGRFARVTAQQMQPRLPFGQTQPLAGVFGNPFAGKAAGPYPQPYSQAYSHHASQSMYQSMQPGAYTPGSPPQPPLPSGSQRTPLYGSMPVPIQPMQPYATPMQSGPGAYYMQSGLGSGTPSQQAAKDSAESAMMEGVARAKAISKRRVRDLAFIHIPGNFGHDVERAALLLQDLDSVHSLHGLGGSVAHQLQELTGDEGPGMGGEAWGKMSPELKHVSNRTGCDLHYTPPKYWPKGIAKKYFRYDHSQNKTVFGLLRDPYDRLVHLFRLQSRDMPKKAAAQEGPTDKESHLYRRYFEHCNVNAWVKAELTQVLDGDRFRANCHLLPQADYFAGRHGIELPIDTRLIPQAFNEAMRNHGYEIRLGRSTSISNARCDVSAWSLDEEAKALIREVYSRDFDLLCRHFGYCDSEELTCLSQFPHMCGGSPNAD